MLVDYRKIEHRCCQLLGNDKEGETNVKLRSTTTTTTNNNNKKKINVNGSKICGVHKCPFSS